MSFVLTSEELVEITGRKQRGKQIEQLIRMKIPYELNAIGKPIVVRQWIESRYYSQSSHKQSESARTNLIRRMTTGEL
ncbi:DUF4224 domain-containing protein [Alteromonas salexigens]|uniref:DUF4224 domain-containing protein n=1 Tax=Alteromonas salexigens TaxID=2982530 RepID=UPI003570E09C